MEIFDATEVIVAVSFGENKLRNTLRLLRELVEWLS